MRNQQHTTNLQKVIDDLEVKIEKYSDSYVNIASTTSAKINSLRELTKAIKQVKEIQEYMMNYTPIVNTPLLTKTPASHV